MIQTRNTIFASILIIAIGLTYSCSCIDLLPKQLEILTSPVITDTGRSENISICFADCDSCQSRTGDCEVCFSPWF